MSINSHNLKKEFIQFRGIKHVEKINSTSRERLETENKLAFRDLGPIFVIDFDFLIFNLFLFRHFLNFFVQISSPPIGPILED